MTHKELLKSWCDAMLRYQLRDTGDSRLDGGILCPACMRVHGRSGDAVLPLVAQWRQSGDSRYLDAAERLFDWSENMVRPDGSYNNDTNSSWNGITVFIANALGETLLHYGAALPAPDREKWLARFAVSARYLLHNIDALGGNINYPVTCAYTMALAAKLLPGEAGAFAAKGKALAAKAVAHITADGLLYGEGHPNEAITEKNCRPVDIGYNTEESLPALALYAGLTGDAATRQAVLDSARTHLAFLLPDGGWDNSFGSRSYKWSYWGSRTSDGCLPGFAALAKYDAVFETAVQRNLKMLAACTHDGLLYGGPMLRTAGEPACMHHTICHAKAVAALAGQNWRPAAQLPPLPGETLDGERYFPTIHTRLLARAGWHATVTDYDYQYLEGGHPTGGAISLLWNAQWGPVLFGGMDPYRQNEPNNMQMPRYQFGICPTPRLAWGEYASSNDLSAWVRSGGAGGQLWAEANGVLRTSQQRRAGGFRLRYTLSEAGFALDAWAGDAEAMLVLPVVSAAGEAVEAMEAGEMTETGDATEARAMAKAGEAVEPRAMAKAGEAVEPRAMAKAGKTVETGKAVETGETVAAAKAADTAIRIRRGNLILTVRANREIKIPEEYQNPDGSIRRLFSPVGGLQAVVLALPAAGGVSLTITVQKEG